MSDQPAARQDVWTSGRRQAALRRMFVCAAVPYLVFVAMLALIQRSLIYQPRREAVVAPVGEFLPGQLHEVVISTEDGISLGGWLAFADGHAAEDEADIRESLDADRPLIAYFCGNAGHRGYRLTKIAMFNRLGCDVFIVDYRGYGGNDGKPSEKALARDAAAVWKHATEEFGVDAGRIIICGESLGGGVATRLTAELCDEGIEPGGLILRATFSSLVDVAAHHYPWLPVRWVLIDRFPSIHRIPSVTCPLLVIHGREDRIVPFEQGQRLFEAAPERSSGGVAKRLLELPAVGHNDIMYLAADQVEAATAEFLASLRREPTVARVGK